MVARQERANRVVGAARHKREARQRSKMMLVKKAGAMRGQSECGKAVESWEKAGRTRNVLPRRGNGPIPAAHKVKAIKSAAVVKRLARSNIMLIVPETPRNKLALWVSWDGTEALHQLAMNDAAAANDEVAICGEVIVPEIKRGKRDGLGEVQSGAAKHVSKVGAVADVGKDRGLGHRAEWSINQMEPGPRFTADSEKTA